MAATVDFSNSKPFLLFLCHPLTGHFTPVFKIAQALHAREWPVSFLGSTYFRPAIEAAGIEFFQSRREANLDDAKLFDKTVPLPNDDSPPIPPQSIIIDLRHQTIDAIPAAWEGVKSSLQQLHRRDPLREVIIISEAFFYGVLPLKFGASLPDGVQRPKSICVSITSPVIRSVDLPPFGFPFPFDPSPQGRARNEALWQEWEEQVQPLTEQLDRKLLEAGAVHGTGEVFMAGANYRHHDAILQIGVPEFEYPRSDFPPGFRVIGINPGKRVLGRPDFPWWDQLIANSGLESTNAKRRRVIAVAQGTVETDPTELIIPTLQWASRRADTIAIAILGSRGATLPTGTALSPNCHIADYLSYDAILPYADLWVHNGGYGATCHGIDHGVPMVIAGEGQDKPESGKRVQWSGIGLDLGTARPGPERLGAAIETVLSDEKFKNAASGMKETAEKMDIYGIVEEELEKLVQGSAYPKRLSS